jgi:hypothetical protein
MSASPAAAARQRRVQTRIDSADAYGLFNLLTGPDLSDVAEALQPAHRERLGRRRHCRCRTGSARRPQNCHHDR